MDISKRRGKFLISDNLIKDMVEGNAKLAKTIFSNVIIARAEAHYPGTIEYMAYSPLFGEIEPSAEVPNYNMIIRKSKQDGETILTLTAEEIIK